MSLILSLLCTNAEKISWYAAHSLYVPENCGISSGANFTIELTFGFVFAVLSFLLGICALRRYYLHCLNWRLYWYYPPFWRSFQISPCFQNINFQIPLDTFRCLYFRDPLSLSVAARTGNLAKFASLFLFSLWFGRCLRCHRY